MKFKAGDKVVYFQKLTDHTDNVVKIREYFIIRKIVDGNIYGPREEIYLESELEFKDIFREAYKKQFNK